MENQKETKTDMEGKTSPFSRFFEMYYELFELISVAVLAVLAVITVSEMASRESFSNIVSSKITALNLDLANIAVNIAPESPSKLSEITFEQKKDVTSKIEEFEQLNDMVSTLINVGVNDQSGTLKELIKTYQDATNRFKEQSNRASSNNILENLSNSHFIEFIYEMRSDHLLAMSIIFCSALGAMIFGLRTGVTMNVRSLTSGMATGFVVYLALKGGQHLFLITSPDIRIPTNPYSSAFAGLLAGLFSDKAYKVLTSVVDDLTSRVETATNGQKSQIDKS